MRDDELLQVRDTELATSQLQSANGSQGYGRHKFQKAWAVNQPEVFNVI